MDRPVTLVRRWLDDCRRDLAHAVRTLALFLQTVSRLHQKGPGFDSDRLLMFQADTSRNGYSDADGSRLVVRLLDALRSTPGVASAGIAGHTLLAGGSWNTHLTIAFTGRRTTERVVHCTPVSPRFFSTLGVRLIAGRDFDEPGAIDFDGPQRVYRTAIVNASFARRYFGDANPIGHRIGFGTQPDTTTTIEIIGVVADFSYRGIREETEQAFFPYLDIPWSGSTFYVRTLGQPEQAFATIREAVANLDPTLPLLSLRTINQQIDRSLMTERLLATLLTGFGAVALLLSVIGLYGVMSFVVLFRTREIGVRVALGATHAMAVWLVVRDALIMIGSGTIIACVGGLAVSRVVSGLLFGVAPMHFLTIVTAAVVLATVALAAAMAPAWRASTVSPTAALHAE